MTAYIRKSEIEGVDFVALVEDHIGALVAVRDQPGPTPLPHKAKEAAKPKAEARK